MKHQVSGDRRGGGGSLLAAYVKRLEGTVECFESALRTEIRTLLDRFGRETFKDDPEVLREFDCITRTGVIE